ncbi:MAG: hypothetical protein NTY95_01030 [Bacteroidia bacterium]|nr:hypothetical protein [Bacteroidia bacterium]
MRYCRSIPAILFLVLVLILFLVTGNICLSQDSVRSSADTISINGQLSLWANYNVNNPLPVITGGRYIPSIYYGIRTDGNKLIDLEASANLYGTFTFHPFDEASFDGGLKPYRLWTRYSSDQFELRLGLQKINFGSASILRPLMWFDQMDPRDPLHLTNGVWALLARYYFLNNANVWLWGLYGNYDPRAWEMIPTNKKIPEFGGRSIDYTFGLGNGLYAAYEHLFFSYDQKAFEFANRTSFSLMTLSYPTGLFGKLSAIVYFNWTNKTIYNFVTWQKQFDNLVLYVMGYWNPDAYELPSQTGSRNMFSGKGIQLMLVFNH